MKHHWGILFLSATLTWIPISRSAPATTPSASETTTSAPRSTTSRKLDLNTATKAELENLPGVGAATADAILAARPFKSVDDLKQVKGVGETRYAQIRPLVTVHAARNTIGASTGSAPGTETSRDAHARISNNANGATPAGLGKGAEQKATSNTAETTININTATREELEALPGIGPAKAQAIIDNRPFKSTDDVMKVKGIKEGTFSEIKNRIRVN